MGITALATITIRPPTGIHRLPDHWGIVQSSAVDLCIPQDGV